jgi:RNA 2',3'-cyclic 3'-phosphodiesterase
VTTAGLFSIRPVYYFTSGLTIPRRDLIMPRLFIAIDLPERIKDDVAATYMALHGARWVPEEQIHLTLRFIGEVPGDAANRVRVALANVNFPSFSLTLKGCGFFPPRKQPNVLWIGIAESEELMRLQSRIERALVAAGIDPDARKFHPHITVARLNGTPERKVAEYVIQNSLFSTEPFAVDSFHLYSSILRKEGAHHIKEASYKIMSQG